MPQEAYSHFTVMKFMGRSLYHTGSLLSTEAPAKRNVCKYVHLLSSDLVTTLSCPCCLEDPRTHAASHCQMLSGPFLNLPVDLMAKSQAGYHGYDKTRVCLTSDGAWARSSLT